jgi:mRNA-degrading endonuclease RelE of RelBE toxin-antitoxin system
LGFEVELSPAVEGYLEGLRKFVPEQATRCADDLEELGKNPFVPRPGVDIKKVKGQPYQYRKREGRHRFGYDVVKAGKVVEVKIAGFK